MKNVIITGGDGFIGSHLSRFLVSKGYEIYAVVIKNSPVRDRIDGCDHLHVVEGDLKDYKEIARQVPAHPEALLHFAWAGVNPEQRNDFDQQTENIGLSLNAVRLAAETGAEKFIFPGSTMEYLYYGKPINKDAIPSPSNAYAAAKVSARYMCSVLCKQLNIPFLYCVISSIYSEDRNDGNVISYTINKLLVGEKPSLTKLEQLWDYVHIDDVVRGLQLIIEKGKGNAFYALGHGDNCPLANYIYNIRNEINPNLPLGLGEVPYSDDVMPSSCVDLAPIYQDTGFVPEISFRDGIKKVIDRFRDIKAGG